MNINVDQWYKFMDKGDVENFLYLVFRKFKIVGYDLQDALNIFGDKEMLLIKPENNDRFSIRYRTRHREDLEKLSYVYFTMADINSSQRTGKVASVAILDEMYDVENLYPKQIMNRVYGRNALSKEDFAKMYECRLITKEENKMELIAKAKERELMELKTNYEKECSDYIKSTDVGKEVISAYDIIKKNTELLVMPEIDILQSINLTDEQYDKIKQFTDKHDKDKQKIDDKYFELLSLYKIAETYEQRTALLKEYGIIKGVKYRIVETYEQGTVLLKEYGITKGVK